jgi:TonB family protein
MVRRGSSTWEIFVAALAGSFALHFFVVVPYVLAPMLEKPDAPLELALDPDVPSSPEEAEPPSPTKEKDAKRDEKKREKKAPEKLAAKAPEPAKLPEEEKKKPPEPAKIEAQQVPVKPVEPPRRKMQMVDQDRFEDEADNPDARFLGQKNHRTAVETQARQTNLIREVDGANRAPSEPNDNKLPEPGAKRDKVAELEDRAGPEKTMPRSAPRQGDEGTRVQKAPPKPGPLSMRDLTPRSTEQKAGQKPREGLEQQESESGTLPMARVGRDGERGHAAQKGGAQVKLNLDHHLYDRIEGFDTAEKERRQAARAESSHKAGRWDRTQAKIAALRSSIENYLPPDVRPGNQTELGTRKDPFARYITSMHRQIHKLFGDGFLADLDGRMGKTPYDDHTIWTRVEIVVNPDGTLHKATIVKSSGVSGFDVAAVDSVMTAAPFQTTPKEIRSPNGKVYVHWEFHRNPDDACGTFNVQPFILTKAPPDDEQHDAAEGAVHAGRGGLRSLKREPREVEALPSAAAPAVGAPEVTSEVRDAAEGWMAAYVRGDAAWLAGWSATPFSAAGEVVASDGAKLKAMYKQLVAEAPAKRSVQSLDVMTPAGIRSRLGGLPPGGEDSGMLFAVGRVAGEEFILLLKKSSAGWRVTGIDR